jgi:3-phenylpropionate/trans-cinnamate dioxygenase ferredoxin subunit
MTWTETGVSAATLLPGRLLGIELGGRSLVLANLDGQFQALDGTCTHEGGILADGELKGPRLVCPVHHANFDVRTGTVLADPDEIEPPTGVIPGISHFPVRVANGMLQVDLPELAE